MDFILLTLGMVGFIVLVLVLLARAYPGSGADLVDWRPTRSFEDEARLETEDIQQMIEAQNEMRRRRGKPDLTGPTPRGWRGRTRRSASASDAPTTIGSRSSRTSSASSDGWLGRAWRGR